MLAGRIGDEPLGEALLLEVAEEEGWKPGAAALALGSPASWASPNAFPIYRKVVHAAHKSQPSGDPDWLFSAIHGMAFAFAHQPETVSRIAGVILAWTIDATNAAGKSVARLVAAARQAIRRPYVQAPSQPDPLVPAVETLRDGLAGTLPAHLAAQYILGLFSELADHDKSMVARLILQPPAAPSKPGQ